MSKKQEEKTDVENARIGLGRFLEKCPQSSGAAAVLRMKHSMEVKTFSEWKAAIEQDMHTKIRR